jgi:hypothetical protein
VIAAFEEAVARHGKPEMVMSDKGGRDASDLLDLRERCLELFKVTSKGGVAEVWLLGQRLLELPAGARP